LYMGVNSIPEIARQFRERSVSEDLPVAIVENGTTNKQRTIFTTASALVADANAAKIVSPAMVFVGESIRAANSLQWFEGHSSNSETGLDDGFDTNIDYKLLIETG
jgi:uroporphyrin-III C-methyltransferase